VEITLLKLGSIAVVMMAVAAFAAKNDVMRKAMKCQDKPEGDKKCLSSAETRPARRVFNFRYTFP